MPMLACSSHNYPSQLFPKSTISTKTTLILTKKEYSSSDPQTNKVIDNGIIVEGCLQISADLTSPTK